MTSTKKTHSASKKKYVRGSKANQPEIAEEYLEAGVELEEAGEKWRAGDSTKALRFFVKAINQYDAGLRAFPTSFDLAYNKARLQYEITQQPQLLEQLPDSRADLLNVARESHILAWRLDNTNTNTLFNLGQVCASLAESVLEGSGITDEHRDSASRLLRQALEVLETCLLLQEKQVGEEKQLTHATTSDAAQDATSDEDVNAQGTEEIWASIEEPLTGEDLFDTCLASVDALKILCQAQTRSYQNDLRLIEKVFSSDLRNKLRQYSHNQEQTWQAAIAVAALLSAYAEVRLRLGITNVTDFENEIQSGIDLLQSLPELPTSPEGLVALGEIYLDFNQALEGLLEFAEAAGELATAMNKSRWEHISRALEFFTAASKLPRVANLARIHLSRGDCEFLRVRLADYPCNYEFARKSQATLLRNADIYYRAAQKVLSYDLSAAPEDVFEARIKVAISSALQNNSQDLSILLKEDASQVMKFLGEIGQQGLLGPQSMTEIHQILETAR